MSQSKISKEHEGIKKQKEELDVNQPPPVSGEENYSFTIKLYEQNGNAWIHFDGPKWLYGSYVALYEGKPPSKPNDRMIWHSLTEGKKKDYDTGHDWGSNWSAGYFVEDYSAPRSGGETPYSYWVTTPVTG